MKFRTTYLDGDGDKVTAVLEAADDQELHEMLHGRGHTLLKTRVVAESSSSVGNVRIHPKKLLMFVQSMAGALDAGVPLLSTLAALADQELDERLAQIYREIGERVSSGEPLSEVLGAYPRSFPYVFCALVRAGEQSGSLPEVLTSVGSFLEWKMEIAGTVKLAMIYPTILAIAGYGLVLFLMAFVIPKLSSILSKVTNDLPAASRLMIDMSGFVAANILWILLASLAAAVAIVLLGRSDAGRGIFAAVFARLPIARNVLHTLNVAQFCRNIGVMLHAGIPVTGGLELCANAITLRKTRQAILDAKDRIMGGSRLTEALEEMEFLPPVAMSMVRVGEEAGKLPITFERLSKVYDREVKEAVKKALGMLEPIVIVLLGVVVGGVAVLVISTIYGAMKGIGK